MSDFKKHDFYREIGRTPVTEAGYQLRIAEVRFHNRGARIRLELHCDDEFVRHLDLTTELLKEALPHIESAARLGRPR